MTTIILCDDGSAYAIPHSGLLSRTYHTHRCPHQAKEMVAPVDLPAGVESGKFYPPCSPQVSALRALFEANISLVPRYPCKTCDERAALRSQYLIETDFRGPVCGPGTHCGRMAINLDAGYVAWWNGGYRDVKEGTNTRSFGPKQTTCGTCGGDLTKR